MKYKFKTYLNRTLYPIAKYLFFKLDAETTHNMALKTGKILGSNIATKKITSICFNYTHPSLEQNILNIHFKNPVGLAGGFDKNAEIFNLMEDVGFGFTEVGSVTSNHCEGNKGKRLDRLIPQNALWINLGLNSKGTDKIKLKLEYHD